MANLFDAVDEEDEEKRSDRPRPTGSTADPRGTAIAKIIAAMATLLTALAAVLHAVSDVLTAGVALAAIATIWLLFWRLTSE
jgi:hypothetical protein